MTPGIFAAHTLSHFLAGKASDRDVQSVDNAATGPPKLRVL